ncbi:MAG TPA: polymer-forming cytoskeletal protein, partial [Desulfobacterales bacterium]|nr:polymer-forming cytoskeletal protein [Desulfobacterales bacterium]
MKKQKEGINAFLGEDTSFEGKLSFSGTVRLDGQFKGEIFSRGTLIVGDTAKLEATIRVGRLISSGEIKGSIIARERMEIHAP